MNIREDLKALLDGELSEARAEQVRVAVASDASLAAELAELKEVGMAVRSAGQNIQVKGAEATLKAVRQRRFLSVRRLAFAVGVPLMLVFAGIVAYPLLMHKNEADKQASWQYASLPTTESAEPGFLGPQSKSAGKMDSVSSSTRTPTSPRANNHASVLIDGQKHKVIQNADLTVRVINAKIAKAEASRIADALGGWTEDSSVDADAQSLVTAKATLRVPVSKFSSALDKLRALGNSVSDHITGRDVTQEYADVNARVKVMQVEEDSYVAMLKSARHLNDVITIKDRLNDLRLQIESLKAQEQVLQNQSAMATISVVFQERTVSGAAQPEKTGWVQQSWTAATEGLLSATRALASVFIFILVYSPLWLPAITISLWASRRMRF